MTKLSVNINKIATLRNSRGGNVPNLLQVATDLQEFGAEGVTLVPDAEDAITSNAGWDTLIHQAYLTEIVAEFKRNGIRTSLFVDPIPKMIEAAAKTGTDRVELYTEAYAKGYAFGNKEAITPYILAGKVADSIGLGLNAGHDLNLDNLHYFKENIPSLLEVSIGHALISEALYLGLQNVVSMYLYRLK